jgi:putative oxidoreductase
MRVNSLQPYALSVLRIVTGFLFCQHGVQKLFGALGARNVAAFPSQAWFAGVLETFGGLLILLGLFTRPVAFILAGMMAVAYFQVHNPQGFWPILNRGELAALYCFVYLYLFTAGAGPLSLDAALRKVRR